jgi:hypothetical protein
MMNAVVPRDRRPPEQPGGQLASAGATAAEAHAAVQVAEVRLALLLNPRRRLQHLQHPAPPEGANVHPRGERPFRCRVPKKSSRAIFKDEPTEANRERRAQPGLRLSVRKCRSGCWMKNRYRVERPWTSLASSGWIWRRTFSAFPAQPVTARSSSDVSYRGLGSWSDPLLGPDSTSEQHALPETS